MKNWEKTLGDLKLPKYILFAVIAFQVVLVVATLSIVKDRGGGSEVPTDSSLIPIWLVILLPLIASRNKVKDFKKKRIYWWLLVGLALLVLMGMITFLVGATA